MKKKLLTLFLAVCAATCLCFGLSACDKSDDMGDGDNSSVPMARILPPYVLSFGTYLYWQPVNNATDYEVYAEETLVETVTDTKYELGKVQNDCTYYVIAKNENAKSKKSNIANVSKNYNFSDDEIYDYSVSPNIETIPAGIRKVVINGDCPVNIFLQTRTTDITFELNNACFEGLSAENNICSRFKADYNVILDIKGECTINGKPGSDGQSFDDSIYDNLCKDGIGGTDGGNGICVPTLILCGSGKLTVKGGNGGNGGNGSNAYGLFNDKKPGKGSFGGNGGSALLTEYLLTEQGSNVTLSLIDGNGGKQGVLGKFDGDIVNGNIVGGIQALLDGSYWIFTDGKDGESSLGTVFNASGKIILNGEEI